MKESNKNKETTDHIIILIIAILMAVYGLGLFISLIYTL